MPLDGITFFSTKEVKRPEERVAAYAQAPASNFVNSIFTQLNGTSNSTSCQG